VFTQVAAVETVYGCFNFFICALPHFLFNAVWLAALCYTNPLFEMGISFLFTPILRDLRTRPRSRWELYSLGCYAASSGDALPMFRGNLSVPSSRVKNPRRKLTTTRCVTTQNSAVLTPLLFTINF
jgi:hypothetical protein